ncbi:hypothetical protein HTZ84_15280 [Haloterrigena sp. SYSU A558-1]|uniref:Secreted protein n=1 Tax=Haloterrigena gelatinilytica TaxID=2741724 RepID=A0ABX2LE12_9EURY|nr:hypothetical protein [Haloterrigena gelatinilytica]NUC73648.1 hypothetical protein [Haloterrigena gelatinilytica]
MADNHGNQDGLKRRGYLKGIAATGLGAGALVTGTGRSHADADGARDIDGDSVYLVFGADSSEADLDSWVEAHGDEIAAGSQSSTAQVIQYQDVSQLNVSQQGNAVSIAIDGGEATAAQQADQNNANTQAGNAESVTVEEETTDWTFTGVGQAYVVFAEETECREFTGLVVGEDAYQSEQSAEAAIDQSQEVDQYNYNSQNTAVAIAANGSRSRAYQRSSQTNENYQHADAVAANIGDGDRQEADASVEQSQAVSQLNVSEQGVAIAIAVGSGSVAEAFQVSSQGNLNEQVADAAAIDFDSKSLDEVTASADMVGSVSDEKLTRSKAGAEQSNAQAASADVTQVQSVGQENINLQNAAVAVGIDDSQATARQESYQGNFNAQVASAEALNVDKSHRSTNAVVTGTDRSGDGSWAVAYDTGNGESSQQVAEVDIDQLQLVEQLNVNEQFGAVAYATDCGDAVAEQLNYQVNENVQLTEARASNEGTGDGKNGKKKKKKKKKNGGEKQRC